MASLPYYLQRVRFTYAYSRKEIHCFCPLVRDGAAPMHTLGPTGPCTCLSHCEHSAERKCSAQLGGTELAQHILHLLPASTSDIDRASAIAALAGTLLDDDCASTTFTVEGRKLDRVGLCLHALTLNPSCADALSNLAAMMDPSGGSEVYANGMLMTLQDVRARLTEVRLQESLSMSRAGALPLPKVAFHAAPGAAAPEEVKAYRKALSADGSGGTGLCSLAPHSALAPAIMRDVKELPWLEATRKFAACPSPNAAGAPISQSFQKAVDALLTGGEAAASAFAELYDMSRQPGQDTVAARIAASAKLYLALGLLLQDSPFTLVQHIEALATFRKPSPPYLADSVQALAEYRAAVVAGVAYFDHTYVLVALLHEALGGNMDTSTVWHLQVSFRAGLFPGMKDAEFMAILHKPGNWRTRLLLSTRTTFETIDRERKKEKEHFSPEGKSAREKWEFYKSAKEGSWAAELQDFNGGKGLTAMDDPYPEGLMSFVGLERIKQQALKFIQEEVEFKRTSVVGAGRERLNYILEGNPGTGKTVIARLWSRLLGQLGLRPNFEAEEAEFKRLQEEAKKAKAAAEKSALDVKLEEAEAAKRKAMMEQMEVPVKVASIRLQSAQDNLTSFNPVPQDVQGLPAKADHSGEALKQACIDRYKVRVTALERAVADCQAALARETGILEDSRRRLAEQEARAAERRTEQADANRQAGAAKRAQDSAPPKRFHEFKGHVLAGESDEKRRLLGVVEMLKEAKPPGGTILVDEAHNMNPAKSENGKAALLYLLTIAEDCRSLKWFKTETRPDGQSVEVPQKPGGISIILTGYEKDISEKLLSADPGLPSRFPHRITFDDYNTEELARIFANLVEARDPSGSGALKVHYSVERKAALALGRRLARGSGARGFGNARTVEGRMGGIIERWRERVGVSSLTFKATSENHRLTMEDVMGFEPDVEVGAVGAIMREMDSKFVGLAKVKASFRELVSNMKKAYHEDCLGLRQTDCGLLNRVFQGPPGTGKSNVAKLYARLLRACGFLSDGSTELTKPADFKGSANGQSGEKAAAIFQRSQGKVLVIDEAYGMSGDDPFNKDIVDVVVAETPDRGGVDIVVVMCGYEDLMQDMFDTCNPGLARRFPENLCRITFDPYSRAELRCIFVNTVLSRGGNADFACAEAAGLALERESTVHNFGNASAAEKFAERLLRFVRARGGAKGGGDAGAGALVGGGAGTSRESSSGGGAAALSELSLCAADVEAMLAAERADDKYSGYVLNTELRDYVDKWSLEVASARILRLPGSPWPHLILKGFPGTGKSTSINVMARELYEKGALPTKRVKEVLGTALQSRYTGGGTSKDVDEAFLAAQGGVLFIDEAHNLVPSGGDYKKDVIASIVGCMTGKYKNKVLVVMAGYPGRMDELLATDPGLPGRFPASANLPEVLPEENVRNIKDTLARSRELKYKSCVPSSADATLVHYFVQRKALRGENYRNRGEAELLAVNIHSTAMRRFEREAQLRAEAPPARFTTTPKTALAHLEESLTFWSSGKREYLLVDVEEACQDMLAKAQKDRDDALAQERKRFPGPPPPPLSEKKDKELEEEERGDEREQQQQQQQEKKDAQVNVLARFNFLLGPQLSQALAEAFQKSPGAYWNLLAGENKALKDELNATLQEANAGLRESDRATPSELGAFFEAMLQEVKARMESGNAETRAIIEADRKAWIEALGDEERMRELDKLMRKDTLHLITTVTTVTTRKCGICGRLDEAGSGCGFGGASPIPLFTTQQYSTQKQVQTFEQ